MLPWAVDIYLSKKFLASPLGHALKERISETRFRTMNEMAADVIRGLPAEWKGRYEVVVLMDSGFCNETACNAVREMGFTYVVAAQSTRVLVKSTGSGRRGKRIVLREYASGRLRYQGSNVVLPAKRADGRQRRFRVAEVVGRLKGLGEVKVVFSQRRSDGNCLPIVTNDLEMDAREVARAYGWRWEIEVAIKALKGCLGFGQYQCRYYEGMVHHLHLSLLAHLSLTAAELARRGRTARSRAALQLPSVAVLRNRLRRDLMRSIISELHPQGVSRDAWPAAVQRAVARLERALAVSA
jgi:SRSO17 transposase